jgi:hypothetical protein
MKIKFIIDEKLKLVFGYLEVYPAICAQASTKEEVSTKIESYLNSLNSKF